MSTENTSLTVAVWRLTNTAFRSRPHEYHSTREAAEARQRDFNMSCDDGGLHNLTPLVLLAEAEKEIEDAKEDMREAQAISDQLQEDIKDLRAQIEQQTKAWGEAQAVNASMYAELQRLREDVLAGFRIANELTLETQTVEEMAADLVRQVREARAAQHAADPGAAGGAEFLSLRLARLAKLVGYPMPAMPHEHIAGIAGTILGRIASHIERQAAATAAQPQPVTADAAELIDDLDELASDMNYEGNCEMDQEKQSRAALLDRGVRLLKSLAAATAAQPAVPDPMTVLSEQDVLDAVDGWREHDAPECARHVAVSYGAARAAMNAYRDKLAAATASQPDINAELLEALEEARNGLAWYQDRFPEATDGSDDEAMARIDAAIAKATGATGAAS